MKQFTIKGLSELIGISSGTVRSWTMKPVDGQPYSSENINYENLQTKLSKYFENFEKQFGFKVEEIEIVKALRSNKKWLEICDLEVDKVYTIHNYSLKTNMKYLRHIEDLDLYIFVVDDDKLTYKTYARFQLEQENIKIEEVEA